MTDFDDWWTHKYGPDPRDVEAERQRYLEENPVEPDYVPDEDDDVDEAKLARYDERA